MELITAVDALAGLLSLPQESDGKEAERQLRLQVVMARSEAENLVQDYLSQQGPPFSDNSKPPTLKMENLPVMDSMALPSSPWKRLSLSLSAFLSFRGWFASVIDWQKSLNPKSRELLKSLENSRIRCMAISSNLGGLLGQNDYPAPSSPTVSSAYKQKVAGFLVCRNYYDLLVQTEKGLAYSYSRELRVEIF